MEPVPKLQPVENASTIEPTPKKTPYRWIAARIESLDPYKDYIEIFRLTSSYNLNDFVNNLTYAIILPTLIRSEHAARAIWREDGGKILNRANLRVDDTETENLIWMYYGPEDPRAIASINRVNDYHAKLEKVTPGCYGHNDDYIYTLCGTVTFGDKFSRKLGLPPFTEKQKIASHLFWQRTSQHFVSIHGEDRRPLVGFPDSYDGCVRFMAQHEAKSWPSDPRSELITEAVYHQFCWRWFPPGLRWLGRVLVISLSEPDTMVAVGVKDVHPITRIIMTWIMTWLFWLLTFAPDPAPDDVLIDKLLNEPTEEKKAKAKQLKLMDKEFCPYFASQTKDKWPGCPYYPFAK